MKRHIEVSLTQELKNGEDFETVIKALTVLFKLENTSSQFQERKFSAEIEELLIETLRQQYGVVLVSNQISNNREGKLTTELFRQLVEEGVKLRQEFEKATAPMRALTSEDLKRVSR